MDKPVTAQRAPYPVEVEAGTTYFWCRCGLSKTQPFCDGAHKSTDITPLKYVAEDNETVYFCGCKHSAAGVMCDGTHSRLP